MPCFSNVESKVNSASTGLMRVVETRSTASVVSICALVFLAATSLSRADCVQDFRKVALDQKAVVPLKSYLCKVGSPQSAAQIRVEFDRLSDLAASLTISGKSSTQLTKTFGAIKIIDNDVSRTYAELVKRFGTTYEVVKEQGEIVTTLSLNAPPKSGLGEDNANTARDLIGPNKVRYLVDSGHQYLGSGPQYPAADEISALRKKTIPDSLNYFYAINSPFCADGKDFVCKKLGQTPVEMVFWRSMGPDDITKYADNARAYNAQLVKIRKDATSVKFDRFATEIKSNYFNLMKYLAGDSWPDDLMIMTGQHQTDSCGVGVVDLPGLAGWTFGVNERAAAMDAMVIENTSKQPVSIGSMFGNHSTANGLRAVDAARSAVGTDAIGALSETLAPGQRLLVPTQVLFLAPAELTDDFRKATKSSAETATRFGLNGFSGRAEANRIPVLKDYAYGPAISIRGIELNSTRIDFDQKPMANFVDLTVTAEAGSCPYLLSRDEGTHEWISHGKVLHSAPSRDREYTDVRTFLGLRTQFRIEEREPEIAHINNVELIVKLENGTDVRLRPRTDALTTYRSELLWGDAIDIDFRLPEKPAGVGVIELRLEVTGYYERYSSLSGKDAPLSSETEREAASLIPVGFGAKACLRLTPRSLLTPRN